MANRTRIVYPGKRNKSLSSTLQTPEEGRSVQWLKRCDKHGDNNVQKKPSLGFELRLSSPFQTMRAVTPWTPPCRLLSLAVSLAPPFYLLSTIRLLSSCHFAFFYRDDLLVSLIWFYAISTIVGYLIPNHFMHILNIRLLNTFCR